MLEEAKNLKDSSGSSNIAIKDTSVFMSFTKTNKLIIALYMVTDIIDKEEPLRNKLRTLGLEIISDINPTSSQATKKISEVLSFLDIASAINLVSEMNSNILKKEFMELKQLVEESRQGLTLSEFFTEVHENSKGHDEYTSVESSHKGHKKEYVGTRIGVQKGSTLLKALSKVEGMKALSDIKNTNKNNFDMLKKQRRNEIIRVIRNNKDGLSIKDIASDLRNSVTPSEEKSGGLGESKAGKTLQRELVSMVKDNILNKTGAKRWSKYSLL